MEHRKKIPLNQALAVLHQDGFFEPCELKKCIQRLDYTHAPSNTLIHEAQKRQPGECSELMRHAGDMIPVKVQLLQAC